MKRLIALPLLAFASPAAADWEAARWGMNAGEVVAASGGSVAPVKEDKNKRIRGMHRLATGKATIEGISFDLDYFFDPKTRKLTAINFVPAKAQCDAARAAHSARFGTPIEKKKVMQIQEGKPPLVEMQYDWAGSPALGNDKINGVDVSVVEMDIRYCQFLRTG